MGAAWPPPPSPTRAPQPQQQRPSTSPQQQQQQQRQPPAQVNPAQLNPQEQQRLLLARRGSPNRRRPSRGRHEPRRSAREPSPDRSPPLSAHSAGSPEREAYLRTLSSRISDTHLNQRARGMRGAWEQTEDPRKLLRSKLIERELSRREFVGQM